jgi:two-component system, sporulation sensor kinase D
MKLILKYKHYFKQLFFTISIISPIIIIFIFLNMIKEMEIESRQLLQFQVKVFEKFLASNNPEDINFFLQNVIKQSNYPIIYADADSLPLYWVNIPELVKSKDSLLILKKMELEFAKYADAIPVKYDTLILGYYFYGEPHFIKQLRYVPIIIVCGLLIILFGAYFGLKYIRKSEEHLLWVGLSKETAHQLGTPVSSLAGWIELLKDSVNKDQQSYVTEMKKDLERLEIIVKRFSQIGSKEISQKMDIEPIIVEVVDYFKKRLPQKSSNILITYSCPKNIELYINKELILWVLENIIKNAIDAIEKGQGIIDIEVKDTLLTLEIKIKDNGKGIEAKDWQRVFEAGFSSKKRGWGLGLSLVKRIIEDHHNGKIKVLQSEINKGTTFLILLNKKRA